MNNQGVSSLFNQLHSVQLCSLYYHWFNQSPIDGHLSYFQGFAIMGSAAENTFFSFMFKINFIYHLSMALWFSSVAQSCLTLCDPMSHSIPGLPVITSSKSSLRLPSIESVMSSSHLIHCHPLLLLPPIPPSI